MGFFFSLWILVWPIIGVLAWKLVLRDHWYRPRVLEARLLEQGIRGPPRSLVSGNIDQMRRMKAEAESTRKFEGITHDISDYILPQFSQWSKTYGVPFSLWFGREPAIFLTDLNIIKQVLNNKSGVFWKPAWMMKFQADILGRGLAVVVGEEWSFRRRFMTPAFHQEKIKGMVGSMVTSVSQMLEKWEELLSRKEGPVEIEMADQFMELTADIISRTAFGSSYQQGHAVFQLVKDLSDVAIQRLATPWIYSILPTSKTNRRIKQIHRQLDSTLDDIIDARLKETRYGNDLLGLMLEAMDASGSNSDKSSFSFTIQSLKEECKTFYVAGHETSSRLLAWTMMLLAANKPWENRARAEALEVCKSLPGGIPDAECLSRLKVIGMVLNETLRLYPPAVYLVRTAYEDIKVKNLVIPAGMGIVIPVLGILHDKEVWGSDADEFNPERFEEGVANAAEHSFAFLPFGQGQRICIGQSFALAEAKLAVAMMLQRFSFSISPGYQHRPVSGLQLMPKHGIQLLVQRLQKHHVV